MVIYLGTIHVLFIVFLYLILKRLGVEFDKKHFQILFIMGIGVLSHLFLDSMPHQDIPREDYLWIASVDAAFILSFIGVFLYGYKDDRFYMLLVSFFSIFPDLLSFSEVVIGYRWVPVFQIYHLGVQNALKDGLIIEIYVLCSLVFAHMILPLLMIPSKKGEFE